MGELAVVLDRRGKRERARKRGPRGFRGFVLLLLALVIALAIVLPGSAARQQQEEQAVYEATMAYWDAQNENNRLNNLLSECDRPDFVERVARRDYGYSLYGETIYEVSNLNELLEALSDDKPGATGAGG